MKNFYRVLANTLIANVTTSYLWFALTFWVLLETESVMAAGMIGGGYMLLVSIFSMIFGTIVDRHRKKSVMMFASTFTLVCFTLAGAVFLVFGSDQVINWHGFTFWLFTGIILIGGVIENMRNIALSTTVTLLTKKEDNARANGLVGATQGVAFMVTSVFSGLSIGMLGMGWTLVIAIALTAISVVHLYFVKIPEKKIKANTSNNLQTKVDIKGSVAAIRAVPGLFWLIIFTTFNNLIGGVYMALMDAYGLSLFAVEVWGVMLGITSIGFIVGGIAVAKKGLGSNPLRTMLLVNIVIVIIGGLFAIREIGWLYVVGIFAYMCLIPAAEAAEQTIIQRVVPLERQGRVFGFAQAIESASAPLSTFMIAPIAEYILIPYMRTDSGHAAFGWLLGSGQSRGIALLFVIASLIMLVIVLLAFRTKAYRNLSAFYKKS